jgi:hypothetical protein
VLVSRAELHLAGRLDGAAAAERIASRYRRMMDVYGAAAAAGATSAA